MALLHRLHSIKTAILEDTFHLSLIFSQSCGLSKNKLLFSWTLNSVDGTTNETAQSSGCRGLGGGHLIRKWDSERFSLGSRESYIHELAVFPKAFFRNLLKIWNLFVPIEVSISMTSKSSQNNHMTELKHWKQNSKCRYGNNITGKWKMFNLTLNNWMLEISFVCLRIEWREILLWDTSALLHSFVGDTFLSPCVGWASGALN